MALFPSQYINRTIPTIESTSVSVTATEVTFNFRSNPLTPTPFRGLLVVKLEAIPAGTTTTLPINFASTVNGSQAVTTWNGAALTVADLPGSGVYLFYYDRLANVLQIMTV